MNEKKSSLLLPGALGGALLLVVGAVFLTRANHPTDEPREPNQSLENIHFSQREATLTYANVAHDAAQELSSFEETDDPAWQGTGFYDDRIAFDGSTSLSLTSKDREPGVAYTEALPPLGQFEHLELLVRLTEAQDLESLSVFLGSPSQPRAYHFPVTGFATKWTVVRMPQRQFVAADPEKPLPWEEVTRVDIALRSRPGETVIANLDSLRVERTRAYLDDWNVKSPDFLGFAPRQGNVHLLGRGADTTVATWKEITVAQDFTYRATLRPLSRARTGLFFRGDYRSEYGYVFWIDGVDGRGWALHAQIPGGEDILASGSLTNVRLREGEPVTLELRAIGETITVSLSFDGERFTRLAEVKDTTFLAGGVGIYVAPGGLTLFNDFRFSP